jgi:hypothetical protein
MEILTVGSFDMPLSFWNHEKHEAHENLNLGTSSLSFRVFGVFRGSHFLIKNSGHRSESDGLMLDSQKTSLINEF